MATNQQGRAEANASPHYRLNPAVDGLPASATLAINERSAALQRQGQQVFRLGLGQSPFPVPDFVVRALRDSAHEKDYLPVRGLYRLREAVAGYYQRTEGLAFSPEHILIGPGSKELMFIAQLALQGELLLPSPSWVSYAPQAGIVGRPVHWIDTPGASGGKVTPDALAATCRERLSGAGLLVLNHPGNPTGTSYEPHELTELAAVARQHGLVVISDEIYSATRFRGEHTSLARYYPEGTIISNGLSKWCGAGGWRLGAFAFPAELDGLINAMASVASETYTATSAPIQYAAVTAFEGGPELCAYLQASQTILAALADTLHASLVSVGAACAPAQGGFYLFPSFEPLRANLEARGIHSSHELCERLLEDTGVATLPGSAFGRPARELSLRLAYVDFDGTGALEAYGRGATVNESFLERYCHRVTEAGRRMAAWLPGESL